MAYNFCDYIKTTLTALTAFNDYPLTIRTYGADFAYDRLPCILIIPTNRVKMDGLGFGGAIAMWTFIDVILVSQNDLDHSNTTTVDTLKQLIATTFYPVPANLYAANNAFHSAIKETPDYQLSLLPQGYNYSAVRVGFWHTP